MSIEFSSIQKEFMEKNNLHVSENEDSYTLHFENHSCRGLTEKEIKYIIDQYISGKYCSYKPAVLQHESSMNRDD